MEYGDLFLLMYQTGFQRVERDDRLLDILPAEKLEKGVELWEKWDGQNIMILKVQLPFSGKKLWLYQFPRRGIEKHLLKNKPATLAKKALIAQGLAIPQELLS